MNILQFKRNGTKVEIIVDAGVMGYTFSFLHECNQDHFAELMRRQYQETMANELKKIREEAYLDGYKDGRAKRVKKTWFKTWWT